MLGGFSGAILTWDQLATNLGVSTDFLRFNNLTEHLTELRKALYLYLPFYYSKRIEVRTSQRKRPMGQNWRTLTGVFQPGRFHVLRNTLLFQHWCVTICAEYWQPRKPIWALCTKFLRRLHHVGWMIELLPLWLNSVLITTILPWRSGWYHVVQSPNPRITWLVFLM